MRDESYPKITKDCLGGAIVTWFGRPMGFASYEHIYVQRIYKNGLPAGIVKPDADAGAVPIPIACQLGPCAPNPTKGRTTISYALPRKARVSLKMYNIAGQLVRALAEGEQEEGRHLQRWDGTASDGRRVPNGLYFCRMTTGGTSITGKIIVVR